MKLSPNYAMRDDLTTFEKWKFSIEERIEKNPLVRSLYRRYYLSPSWLKNTIEIYFILFSIFPVILAAIMCLGLQNILSQKYMSEETGILGLTIYVGMVATATYFHPIGWLLVFMTSQLLICLFFIGAIRDYDLELELEEKNKKATR